MMARVAGPYCVWPRESDPELSLKRRITLILVLGFLSVSLLQGAQDTLSITLVIQDVVAVEEVFVPSEFALHPPYPNPFNAEVNFTVDIPEVTATRISVLDLRGREVFVIEEGLLQPGRHQFIWQAAEQPSGLYFVRVRSAQFESTQKLSLLK